MVPDRDGSERWSASWLGPIAPRRQWRTHHQRREAGRDRGKEGPLRLRASLWAFERYFAIPDDVNADKIEATFKNGVQAPSISKRRGPCSRR
ncbi:Hsp20/alpha crystallin family protein [Bradyrhizobium liaoningense]|uniref:Hsp20 family protein n=1 Tax=Bradyrhizobium liaoningense TaxID=43992 RepID=UPI002011E01D|nr:Hsp20/alpha crystallin family protein [Bradyrhizobium liaoningense]